MSFKTSDITVLVIDDDIDQRYLIRRILVNKSYNVIEAESLSKAMSVFEEFLPHIVLLDLEIKKDTGLDFIDFVKKHPLYKNIPIIVISAHNSTQLILECVSKGAEDYLVKPVAGIVLTDRLNKILHKHLDAMKDFLCLSPHSEIGKAKLRFNVNVDKLGENGIEFATSFFAQPNIKVNVVGTLLTELGVDVFPKKIFKSIKLQNVFPGGKIYSVYVGFVGLKEESQKNIKYFINNYLINKGKK